MVLLNAGFFWSFSQRDCAGSLEPFGLIVAAHINILVNIYQMCNYYSMESKFQSASNIWVFFFFLVTVMTLCCWIVLPPRPPTSPKGLQRSTRVVQYAATAIILVGDAVSYVV